MGNPTPKNSAPIPQKNNRQMGLYIHWPYCLKKCPYCDFNSHVRQSIDYDRMAKAYVDEMHWIAEFLADHNATPPPLHSIYFGGGTPSTMPPEITARLIDTARQLWGFTNAIEITLEANPTSVEISKLSAFRTAGVNRVSLGVQALNDDALKQLGRDHSARDALYAVEQTQSLFDRASFDLIYARPHQTVADWVTELSHALNYIQGHISLYQLTIEPQTEYHHRWKRGEIILPDEKTAETLFTNTNYLLAERGYQAYEVSNYAQAGDQSRHNTLYWQYQDYIGIGAGAHGRLTTPQNNTTQKWATECTKLPESWCDQVEKNGHAMTMDMVDTQGRLDELMLMGLRLTDGVPESRLMTETGDGFGQLNIGRLETLLDDKLLVLDTTQDDPILRTTSAGRLRLNAVLAYLL